MQGVIQACRALLFVGRPGVSIARTKAVLRLLASGVGGAASGIAVLLPDVQSLSGSVYILVTAGLISFISHDRVPPFR